MLSDPVFFRRYDTVCGNAPSLWLLYGILSSDAHKGNQKTGFLLIASSNAESFPSEWKKREFRSEFENIYFAFPNDAVSDKNVLKAAQTAAMATKRLRLPAGFDHFDVSSPQMIKISKMD